MIAFPNAKINLGLHVIARRSDGYHDIETIFCPIDLCDILEIVSATQTKFIQSGIPMDCKISNNLVMKAYQLLKKHYNLPEITIHLRKNIPIGAGLGGGSSDASFMLYLLSNLANLCLSIEELEAYAKQLGSDCPFFIRNKPVFAKGIGNIFTPIELDLKKYNLALVTTNIHISTSEAYTNIVVSHTPRESLTDIIHYPVDKWKNRLVNDFEEDIFPLYPEIREIKQELYNQGAIYASMSGSGSSVYGLFKKPYRPIGTFNFSIHNFI
ncbi:MAG: 4-(cytidine 5'-diphospho)-2-C-methyl-D-erythritol kinase [Candidatus Azobacteroides pseudotrichonymphae]|jgi:4-diphosphocytidyl-2-C-methyl-D-erythritol kinase|nr:4-(cytidine 5'-diphospho)-2-C-methyl-D-erythritol kinase [Bacteroidales bacterium OttesenSCG-928-I14]GMO35778.1 MAG: 4-(cytidine 5'-diphospho)-2-C-methyl-D-erythritol kinase [Candidatus Azobacteroides pseudotrichonymphae]